MSRTYEMRNLSQADAQQEAQNFKDDGATVEVIPQGGGLYTMRATYPDAPAAANGAAPAAPANPAAPNPAAAAANAAPAPAPVANNAGGAAAPAANGGFGVPGFTVGGVALLKKWEGCILQAYDDATETIVRPGQTVHGTLTIGYGHTGSDVFIGQTWTQAQAEQALQNDIANVAQDIRPLIQAGLPALTANQFSALVCLAFNIGTAAFAGSSARAAVNAGNLAVVPADIALWHKTTVDGVLVDSPGLVNRRAAEVALWNTP